MSDLKLSITILVSYIIVVLGIPNIDAFQNSIINFSPIFFILLALAVFVELLITGVLIKQGVRITNYMFLLIWGIVYLFVWFVYWQGENALHLQVVFIQFLLVELAAGLAYDVGKRIGQIDKALDGLSSSTYPNRMQDIQSAENLINDELTRSRRYHHPLSVLVLKLEEIKEKDSEGRYEPLQHDMLQRFVSAKVGQIISDLSRQTDIVLRDHDGQFVVLCPETDNKNLSILASRIGRVVDKNIGETVDWAIASFPDEALTFKDLLQTAKRRLGAISIPQDHEENSNKNV